MIVAALLAGALEAALAGVTPQDLVLTARALKLRGARVSLYAPTFRGAALEMQTATHRECIVVGPADTGKTVGLCWRLDSELRKPENARAQAVILRKVRAHIGKTVLKTWKRIIEIRGGVTAHGGEHPEWYQYKNGARCYVDGLDDPQRVLSAEFDFIYGNQVEEFSLNDWETLTGRVTGRGAVTKHPMIFGDANPSVTNHWILGRSCGENGQPGPLRLLYSRHEDNPELYDDDGNPTEACEARLAPLRALTGIRRKRFFLGQWGSAEGQVYDTFDRAVHVVPAFEIPKDWRAFVSIDFGFTNPFVAQLWRVDPDGRLYLTRELYRTQRIVEDHARDIRAMVAGLTIEAAISDHDAEDRATLERYWRSTIPAHKGISDGIQAVQARLAPAKDGKPRLFVVDGALVERDEALASAHKPVSTLDEFEAYSWPKGGDGKALKEAPVKTDDHGMDAMRYMVAHIDGIAPEKYAGWFALGREAAERAKAVA